MTLGTWTRCFKISRTIACRKGFESYTRITRWEEQPEMVVKFGVKWTWELSNPLKRAWPIDRNSVNNKLATKTKKNSVRDKSTKVEKKSVKTKNKLAIEIEKNSINHETSKHGVRGIPVYRKPIWRIKKVFRVWDRGQRSNV